MIDDDQDFVIIFFFQQKKSQKYLVDSLKVRTFAPAFGQKEAVSGLERVL